MSGYLDRTGYAKGSLDQLEANLLWISSTGAQGVLWISLDVLAVSPLLRKAIVDAIYADSGIAQEHIVIVASHTHSGPGTVHEQIHPVFPDDFDPVTLDRLASGLALVAAGLVRNARPARLTWRTGEVQGVGSNRHNVDGPHDSTLGLLEVTDVLTDARIAVMFDYACHPTVLGPENLLWSADWVEGARQFVRESAGRPDSPLPVVFLQGCAADASTRFFRTGRTPSELRRLGGRVGHCISDLLATPGDAVAPFPVRVERTTLHLPVRRLESAGAPVTTTDARDTDRLSASFAEGQQALEALKRSELPPELDLPISIVSIGERRWMHLPVEMCATYGFAIGAGRETVRVIGYADSYRGYIADRESFREGHYEALASFFDEATCHRFMVECLGYLGNV